MKKTLALICLATLFSSIQLWSQSLGNAGTIEGTVVDPSGALVAKAHVELENPVPG